MLYNIDFMKKKCIRQIIFLNMCQTLKNNFLFMMLKIIIYKLFDCNSVFYM